MLKKIVDRIFMKKEINLKHLGEIDKVHDLSSHLFSRVNKMMSGFLRKSSSETSDATLSVGKENNQANSSTGSIKTINTAIKGSSSSGATDSGNKNKL